MTTGSQPSEPSDRSNSNPADVINGALVQQAATLHQQTARESPLFASFFTGPGAAREFATLVHRLIVHQGRLHGFKVESGPAGPGRGWVVCGSGFLGFQGNTAVVPQWIVSGAVLDEEACRQAVAEMEAVEFPSSGAPVNFVPVFQVELTSPQVQWSRDAGPNRPQRVCPVGSATCLEWLRACPPLLARYLPQEAARLPDAREFSGRAWTDIRDEFLRLSLPARRDLRVERMSARHTEDEGHPVNVQLPDVFVPQQFVPKGQPVTATLALSSLVTRPQPKILLGDPGSGKSTVLSALALAAAGEYVVEDTAIPRAVALFLALRRFSRERRQRPRFLDALVHHARSLGMSPGDAHPWFFEGLLEMGEAVVLFDGLDEAGDRDTRKWVVQQIDEFRRRYPLCSIWVTSRKVGYDGAPLDSEAYGAYTVAPFDKPRHDRFIRRWYADQCREEPAQGSRLANSLCQSLDRSRPDVQRMAGNPLLLTLMALIHRSKGGHLPHNRGELYEECVELLLDRWEKAKRDPDEEDDPGGDLAALNPRLDRNEIRRYLTTIAFEIQEKNESRGSEEWGNIPCSFLRKRLTELRQKTRREADDINAKADVEVLLRYIQDRAGLLVWNGEDAYAFSHLSFQEYLAACKRQGGDFRLDDHVHFFAQKAAEPKWRETLVLLLHRIQTHSTSEQPFTDLLMDFLVGHAMGRSPAQAPAVWRTLGMALRDEIPFAPAHQREILRQLVGEWLDDPKFEGETVAVLEDLALFSPLLHPLLTEVLAQPWREAPPDRSLAALHLRVRLLGWPVAEDTESQRLAAELETRVPSGNNPAEDGSAIEQIGRILADAGLDKVAAHEPGARCVHATRAKLQTRLIHPDLPARVRADAGIVLGRLGDPRPGVGLRPDGLPDLDFTTDPLREGRLKLGESGEVLIEQPYRLCRYPVTVAQFQAFVDAKGYEQDQFWHPHGRTWRDGKAESKDLPEWYRDEYQKLDFPIRGPQDYDPVFQTPNHPRVGVSWYEAAAFCAWLSHKLKLEIRLPHEAEWEQAARWNKTTGQVDERRYPWGGSDEKELGQRCNCRHTGIGHTSAVGLFPIGNAECGAADLSGNVWEWCNNLYRPDQPWRVLRGGSWANGYPGDLSGSFRYFGCPGLRRQYYGFRCVVVVGGSARG